MKTKATASTTFAKICLFTTAVLLLSIALATFVLALGGDTTPLGDPYYQDTILAPARAFIPWLLSLLAVGAVIAAKLVDWWKQRHDNT